MAILEVSMSYMSCSIELGMVMFKELDFGMSGRRKTESWDRDRIRISVRPKVKTLGIQVFLVQSILCIEHSSNVKQKTKNIHLAYFTYDRSSLVSIFSGSSSPREIRICVCFSVALLSPQVYHSE